MKIIKTLLVIFLGLLIVGCDNNDDAQTDPINPTDGFTFNNTFYETANAYIDIDVDDDDPVVGNDGQPDSYTFFFTDGRMFDNDANVNGSTGDYLYSLNTTKLVFLNVLVTDNPSLANSPPTAGNTYIVSSTEDTVILHDGQIDPLSPPYLNSGIEFGVGDENVGTFHLPGIVGPTVTFNTFNYDNTNPANSTIDIDYTFMNEDGEMITGHYEGTFGIILD